jgi:hypothetical protein
MNLLVDIYTLEKMKSVHVGTISFDGTSLSCDPPDNGLLLSIMQDRVFILDKTITPKQPEEWLKAIHTRYRGAYLRVSEARSISNCNIDGDNWRVYFMATKEPGFGRESLKRICEDAVKRGVGVTLTATPDSEEFFKKMGMRLVNDEYVFTKEEAAMFMRLKSFAEEPRGGVFVDSSAELAMKVVAQKSNVTFLIQVGDDPVTAQGIIVKPSTNERFAPRRLQTIVAQGYWEECEHSDELLQRLLAIPETVIPR